MAAEPYDVPETLLIQTVLLAAVQAILPACGKLFAIAAKGRRNTGVRIDPA
jgi:hypothetical protein